MFGLYYPFLHTLSLQYGAGMVFFSTATDFANYDEPFRRAVGTTQELVLNLEKQSTMTIHFEQLVVRTYDGMFSRKMSEKRVMQFKNTSHKSQKRSLVDKFLSIEFEVSDDIMLVERVYPNLIDLFSDIGGVLKILTFLCIAIGALHNWILFNKHSLDSVLLPN